MLTLNFDPFPELFTDRLVLRRISTADEDAIFQLRSNKKTMEFLDRPMAKTRQDALLLIQKIETDLSRNDGITWGISLKDQPRLIGTIGFWRIMKENYRAEIGYMIDPSHQGKGLMHEAIVCAIDYGFNLMKLHSIEANVNPKNEASMKILKKNHFIREAYFRENYYFEGKFLDSVIYSLIATDR